VKVLTRHDTRELRAFGLGLAMLLVLVFFGLLPWLGDRPRPAWPVLASALIAVAALGWPPALLPIYRLLRPVARVLGTINTWLLLGTLYFGMLTPVGWILRRLGRLQYTDRPDASAGTYRVDATRRRPLDLKEPF
jgi:hypothetical protein